MSLLVTLHRQSSYSSIPLYAYVSILPQQATSKLQHKTQPAKETPTVELNRTSDTFKFTQLSQETRTQHPYR